VEEIFGARLKTAKVLEANWLESKVFLNRGNKLEAKALLPEAQKRLRLASESVTLMWMAARISSCASIK